MLYALSCDIKSSLQTVVPEVHSTEVLGLVPSSPRSTASLTIFLSAGAPVVFQNHTNGQSASDFKQCSFGESTSHGISKFRSTPNRTCLDWCSNLAGAPVEFNASHYLFSPELDLFSCEQRSREQQAWPKLSA